MEQQLFRCFIDPDHALRIGVMGVHPAPTHAWPIAAPVRVNPHRQQDVTPPQLLHREGDVS